MSNTIITNIESLVNKIINDYNKVVSSEFGMDIDVLNTAWVKFNSGKKQGPFSLARINKFSTSSTVTCAYVYAKGDRIHEKCGKNVKEGNMYCTTHMNKEELLVEEEEVVINDKPCIPSCYTSSSEKHCMDTLIPPVKSTHRKLRFNNKINHFWEPNTTFVLKSAQEYMVIIGKAMNDGVIPLTVEDLKIVHDNGNTYEPLHKKWLDEIQNEPITEPNPVVVDVPESVVVDEPEPVVVDEPKVDVPEPVVVVPEPKVVVPEPKVVVPEPKVVVQQTILTKPKTVKKTKAVIVDDEDEEEIITTKKKPIKKVNSTSNSEEVKVIKEVEPVVNKGELMYESNPDIMNNPKMLKILQKMQKMQKKMEYISEEIDTNLIKNID